MSVSKWKVSERAGVRGSCLVLIAKFAVGEVGLQSALEETELVSEGAA
jgi:hypothetical protein